VLAKLAAKALAPTAIDATSNFAKDKGSGMGIKKTRKKARECYKTLNKKRQLKN
jgi:hypothetical protein